MTTALGMLVVTSYAEWACI